MDSNSDSVARRLDNLAAEFAELEPRERLEVLLEYCDKLAPLPAKYQAERDAGEHRVHECQTPVFLWVELVGQRVQIWADVAPEAPTVKGFVGLLIDAFQDMPASEVLSADAGIVQRLGLSEALGMLRMRGLSAILAYIRTQVRRAVETNS